MNKEKLTEDKAKQSPSGGVVVGKRNGQTMIYDDASVGGYFVGKTHAEGGIKMINKSTGQPLEVQGAEVIITAPAVADQTKREFEGRMMTNREILSEINKRGGGVSFADGGNIPTEMHFSGNSYKYGGKTVSDHDIAYEISKCGCEHGGHLSKGMSLKQIAKMHGVTLLELNRQVKMGLDAESEHTPKVTEQMKIVKDHLYENPNYYSLLKKAGLKKGGEVDYVTYKDKYNKKYNYDKNTSHDLDEISKDTGISVKGLQQIYNKGIGAYKTNPSSVRPNVKSKEQWAMARVYSAVMGGKASEVDSNELKMNHGGKVKESLVKDAKSGNSPSRDLNNYNDLMDVEADGVVGGYSGIYANGGALGTSGLPLVDYIVIINGGSHLKGLRSNDKYYDFQSLKKRVAEEYKLLPTSPIYRGYIEAQAYDTEGNALATPNTYISDMKNTVKNFNPYTGKPSDLEKSFANSRPVSFKKYDWSEWFSGKKSMPTKQASATSNLVTGIYISYTNPTNNSLSSFTVDNASEFLYTLLNLYRNSITKIDYRIIVNGNILEETISDLKLNDDVTDNWRLNPNTINPKVATLDDVAYRLEKENSFFDFTNFMKSGGLNAIGQPTATTAQPSSSKYPTIKLPFDLEMTKIWIGDNPELSRRVQERAMELGWDWWSGNKKPANLEMQSLFFNDDEKITGTDTRQSFEGFKDYKEIFESDLFGSATTATQTQPTAPLTQEQKIASEFVADDSVLRKNDILGSSSLQQDRNDLDALTKLLPSFQQSKFSNEKSSILKEMARIQKKLDYKGFIASNEEVSKGKDLFTPQGLLNYYFTQATQNPTAELQPPCELPTPNGGKSKLPLVAYLNVRSSQFKKWFGDWEKAYETDNYVNCSKMIDEETKEPKIFYHGVRKYIPSFGQMSNMGVGVVRPYGSFEPPNFPASYFANNESYANFYGGIAENMPKPSEGYKPFIYKVFLCIKNPISLLPLDFEVSYRDLIDYVLVAYGIRLNVNSVLLKQLGEDMNKKHPMWIYIRRDIGLIEMLKDKGYDALIQQGDIPVFDKNGEVVSDRSKFIKDIEYLSFYPNQVKSATVKKSFYFNFFNDIRFKKGGYVRI